MPAHDDSLLTTEEVAQLLRLPIGTLYRWRYHGTGPRALKVGRHLRYRAGDVDAWLARLARQEVAA